MRIAVTAVAARKAGGSTLILEKLIEHVPRIADRHEFRFFVSKSFAASLVDGGTIDTDTVNAEQPVKIADNLELVAVPPRSQLKRLFWDQLSYPRSLRQYRPDVTVNALGFGPLYPGVPQYTFLQDSTYFCAMRAYRRSALERARTEALRRLLLEVMRRSERIVVPSRALANAIARDAERLENKLVVLRDPFEAEYKDPIERDGERTKSVSQKAVRILYLSHLEPHKAHPFLPSVALELEKRTSEEFTFVVAVDRDDSPRLYDEFLREIQRTGTEKRFEIHPRLPHAGVTRELARADVFFFPSLCESFGYPMAEAGAAGLPVVASDTAVNREMLGEDALYFDPLKADKAAQALERLIRDAGLRLAAARAIQLHQRSLFLGWEEYSRRAIEIVTGNVDES